MDPHDSSAWTFLAKPERDALCEVDPSPGLSSAAVSGPSPGCHRLRSTCNGGRRRCPCNTCHSHLPPPGTCCNQRSAKSYREPSRMSKSFQDAVAKKFEG